MKKILSLICMMFVCCGIAKADIQISDLVDKIPDMKQGIGFSIEDSKFNYLSTIKIAEHKESGITLEAGYMGDSDKTDHKAVLAISYPIVKLKDFVDMPILDLVELNLGLYAGYGHIQIGHGEAAGNNEFDWGASATFINLKF